MKQYALVVALTGVCAVVSQPTPAQVVAGNRVFPVTLTFDDPGDTDDAALPQFLWQRVGPADEYHFQWEFDKTITPNTALSYNQGWVVLRSAGKTQSGLENAFLTGKWQAYVNAEHEFVMSLGVIREFGGGSGTEDTGGDAYGATAPTLYAGKGLGDLSISLLRPLALTGQLSYAIADRRLNSSGDNNGSPNSWSAGFSIQYSIPYLQSHVRDVGLPGLFGRLIPLIETTWYSPASGPTGGFPPTLTVAPGVIYMADSFQVGVEALIPVNKSAGEHVGVIAKLNFFFDDLFPRALSKPVLSW